MFEATAGEALTGCPLCDTLTGGEVVVRCLQKHLHTRCSRVWIPKYTHSSGTRTSRSPDAPPHIEPTALFQEVVCCAASLDPPFSPLRCLCTRPVVRKSHRFSTAPVRPAEVPPPCVEDDKTLLLARSLETNVSDELPGETPLLWEDLIPPLQGSLSV